MAIKDDPKETTHPLENRTNLAGESTKRPGFVAQGFKGDVHGDVLRRVNRKPLDGQGRQTVTTEGNVITVIMPNHATFRLTLGEREPVVPPEAQVPKPPQKDLPRGSTPPETITAADVKTWEYSAPPELPKATAATPAPVR